MDKRFVNLDDIEYPLIILNGPTNVLYSKSYGKEAKRTVEGYAVPVCCQIDFVEHYFLTPQWWKDTCKKENGDFIARDWELWPRLKADIESFLSDGGVTAYVKDIDESRAFHCEGWIYITVFEKDQEFNGVLTWKDHRYLSYLY